MTATRTRIPKSPDERRAARNARQARWRANAKRKAAVDANIAHAAGLDDGEAPPPMPDMAAKDLAALLRNRIIAMVEKMPDAALLDKDLAPILNVGLKAERQIEDREKVKAKDNSAQAVFALIQLVSGEKPLTLQDGLTIEGDAVEVD